MDEKEVKQLSDSETEQVAGGYLDTIYCPFCKTTHECSIGDRIYSREFVGPDGNTHISLFRRGFCLKQSKEFSLLVGKNGRGVLPHERQVYLDMRTNRFLEGNMDSIW